MTRKRDVSIGPLSNINTIYSIVIRKEQIGWEKKEGINWYQILTINFGIYLAS